MPEYVLILIRSVGSFIVLLALARLMGKRQIAQLTFFDYVVGITIGSIAASMSADQNIKIFNGMVGLVVWGFFPILLSFMARKSYWFRRIVQGVPTILIQNGKILEKSLRKNNMSEDELVLNLREKNAFKLADVEFAILETNGEVSVLKKTDAEPVTPKTLGLYVEQEHDPRIVIIDGHVMNKTLTEMGYSADWLLGEVMKQGAKSFEDVFVAQLDSTGNVYVDLYDDQIQYTKIKQKPLLAASLKKMQAELEIFSLETNNEIAKQMYEAQAKQLQQIVQDLAPYLKE
jgi:uncharacterized membrane protein YcaP (DUF421 family)